MQHNTLCMHINIHLYEIYIERGGTLTQQGEMSMADIDRGPADPAEGIEVAGGDLRTLGKAPRSPAEGSRQRWKACRQWGTRPYTVRC